MDKQNRRVWRYGLVAALVTAATFFRWMYPSILTGTPYLVFYPAVAISAAVGGGGPGVLATVLSVCVVDLLFDSSYLRVGFEDPVWRARQIIFFASGIGVSCIARMLESARVRERQQAFEIAEQRNKYRIVADNTYDWEFWLSPEEKFLYNSPSCMRVTGYEVDAFQSTPELLRRIVHPDDQLLYEEHRGVGAHACKTQSVEFRIIRRDGDVRWIHHTCLPVYDEEGRYLGVRGTNRDITDRKLAELALAAAKLSAERAKADAEQANQAKDRVLAMLSHELRTPLAPVLAAVSLYQKKLDPSSELSNILEMIRRNVELEARLIDDLLDVTGVVQGKIELHKRPVELCLVIAHAVEVCRPDIDARRLHFGVDLGEDASYVVEADVGRLQQVFWNLLKNAIKFTPDGGCVDVRCRSDGHGGVVAEVNDSGIGIEPENMGSIFGAFVQADGGITRQYGGLGLGLAISKSLVELHGGTIEGTSPGKGQGSSFRVRLPLASERVVSVESPSDDGTSVASRELSQARANGVADCPRAMRLLVVEDHGDSAEMLRVMLESGGHHVEVAGSRLAAMEKAAQNSFDLLICDLGLPDGSGLDVMRDLRACGRFVPGIALSGYGQEQDVRQSRDVGFADHLTKPVDMDRLLAALAKVAASIHAVQNLETAGYSR